jgi:predicted TIM-barrel fold metal-dependent hydrolase
MNIIDMHAHIAQRELFPEHFLTGMKEVLRQRAADELGVELQPGLLERVAARRLRDGDCSQLLAEMDAAGIGKTVLLLADFGFGHEEGSLTLSALYDHHHHILRQHPTRFVVFGGTDPRRGPQALSLFEHGLNEFCFRGLKLYPACGYEADDPGLLPYYELCQTRGLPVLLHTGPALATHRGDTRYPEAVHDVALRFPRLRLVLGHAAFQNPEVNIALAQRHRNVYLETSGFQRVRHREELASHLRKLFDVAPEQVVFGTDWPVFNIKGSLLDWVKLFEGLGVLDERGLRRLFHDNAREVLGEAA